MRTLERYYNKIYRETDRLLKKMFGFGVQDGFKRQYEVRKEIESQTGKPIAETTVDDLIKYKLSVVYCEYRTLSKILEVLSGACFLKTFTADEIKEYMR